MGIPPQPAARPLVKIYADRPFYRERPEPEQTWTGVLRRVQVPTGPNTREHPYKLEITGEFLALYISGPEESSAAHYLGRQVEITGKRIDCVARVTVWKSGPPPFARWTKD